ncbi:hypothetical protein EBR43_12315 [bacterium]|nr:hypothetical protein [bacterium]
MNLPDGPSVVDVNPSFDPEARYALASLLGATLAELKNIDSNIVGGSSNIRANKTDINKVIPPVAQPQTPLVQQPTIQQPAITVTIPQPQFQPPVHVPTSPAVQEDPNQLLFDFNQKITPDTVNNKLDSILDKLNRIIELLK